jgi:hypothetical protein
MTVMRGFKCVECQSLFPREAIVAYAYRTGKDLCHLNCPVCDARFTDGKFGQEYHGQSNPPSIRDCCWTSPTTASPDDR